MNSKIKKLIVFKENICKCGEFKHVSIKQCRDCKSKDKTNLCRCGNFKQKQSTICGECKNSNKYLAKTKMRSPQNYDECKCGEEKHKRSKQCLGCHYTKIRNKK